jgi:tetratricopeptide (TPR) repeat protein
VPLFVLAAGSCIATLLVQTRALSTFEEIPLRLRIANALVTYVTYIWQMFWPARLVAFYPYPYNWLPIWEVALAGALLVAVAALTLVLRKKRPYFITGWLWYVVMLVPVIGIVQVGNQGHADRYTYLPPIGLYVALTWAIADLAASWRYRRQILAAAGAIMIGLLSYWARIQTSYWRDSESLWTHALAVSSNNDVAHYNLGLFYAKGGRADDAISEYRQALNTIGHDPTGRPKVSAAQVHNNLGILFEQRGRADDAISEYEQALGLIGNKATGWASSSAALAHSNLGNVLLEKGRLDEAIMHHRKGVELDPDYADGHYNLGSSLLRKGEIGESITEYERCLQIRSTDAGTMNHLAWVFATCPEASLRNGARAIELAEKADKLAHGKNPIFIRT